MIEWARSRSTVIDRLIAAPSLDHVVGAAKKRGWEGDAEGFGGLQVDKQLDVRDLLARQISRLGALDSSSRYRRQLDGATARNCLRNSSGRLRS